ncbi:cyanovirin-n family protein [Penicillium sp. IBT 35674x]|nr:cyanovirin-n family protein [Penicillium sp. IBT 35674x]
MSFHESANNIELEDGHILKAKLQDGEGEEREVEMNLNDFIGNDNGCFCWGGENFKDSATNIELSLEGPGIPVLRANLFNVEGEEVEANINLAERISNENGELVFV